LARRLSELRHLSDDTSAMLRRSLVNTIGLQVINSYGETSIPIDRFLPKLSRPVALRIEEYIAGHLDQHLNLEELAAVAQLSVHHFLSA
ncbi:hypothetical protein ABTL87_19230, partial [Acinetobacter baumannii]